MPKRRVVVLTEDKDWICYLKEVFEDTLSVPEVPRNPQEGLNLVRQNNIDIVFASPNLVTQPVAAALLTQRTSNRSFRVFSLGLTNGRMKTYPFDEQFEEIPSFATFYKMMSSKLAFDSTINILIIDDEKQICEAFREYLTHQINPSFSVSTACDGSDAEKKIKNKTPDVIILDIKMPEKDGRELYKELQRQHKNIATIVFFDSVSADEVIEIKKHGNPAFIEKGSRSSALPEMTALIIKMAYFA